MLFLSKIATRDRRKKDRDQRPTCADFTRFSLISGNDRHDSRRRRMLSASITTTGAAAAVKRIGREREREREEAGGQ